MPYAISPFSRAELLDFATEFEGHPDNVAASLLGSLVISMMQGSHVHSIQLDCAFRFAGCCGNSPTFRCQLKQPAVFYLKTVDFADAIHNVSRSSMLVGAIATGKLEMLSLAMADRLHQPYRTSLIPGFDDVAESAMRCRRIKCGSEWCRSQHRQPTAQHRRLRSVRK